MRYAVIHYTVNVWSMNQPLRTINFSLISSEKKLIQCLVSRDALHLLCRKRKWFFNYFCKRCVCFASVLHQKKRCFFSELKWYSTHWTCWLFLLHRLYLGKWRLCICSITQCFNHLYPQLTVTNLYSSPDPNNQMNMLVLETCGLSPFCCGVEYWMLLLIACS